MVCDPQAGRALNGEPRCHGEIGCNLPAIEVDRQTLARWLRCQRIRRKEKGQACLIIANVLVPFSLQDICLVPHYGKEYSS